MRVRFVIAALALAAPACFFELGELVEPGVGGAGGDGGSTVMSSSSVGGGGSLPVDWWDGRFTRRHRIDFLDVTTPVSDARIPVVLPMDFAYGDALVDGSDLRFIDDDGTTLLSYEIERFDAVAGSIIWLRVPEVTPGDHVWLYYGRPDALAQSDPAAVWAGYQGVYHLNQDPSASGPIVDASPNQKDGTPTGFAAGASVEGKTGAAIDFGPTASRGITIDDDAGFSIGAGEDLTVELWMKWDPARGGGYLLANEGCCIGYSTSMVGQTGIVRQSWRSGSCCAMPQEGDYVYVQRGLPGGDSDTDWHHVVLVFDRSVSQTARYYVDGALWEEGAIDAAPGQGNNGQLRLGADFNGDESFAGILDEFRFAKRIYGVAEIQLNYAASEGNLLSFSPVESL